MRRGGGGRGGSGGRDDAALLRQIRSLFVDGSGDGGGGGARGSRGARAAAANGGGGGGGGRAGRAFGNHARAAASGGGLQSGAADWTCGHCGFAPNFGRRRHCFDCGRPKSGGAHGAAAAAPARAGPMGAGGARPLLAWGNRGMERQAASDAPTRRVPGASAAALVEEARRSVARATPANAGNGVGASGQAAPRSTVDADGFITVGKRGKPAAAAAARVSAAGAGVGSADDEASMRAQAGATTAAMRRAAGERAEPPEDEDAADEEDSPQGPDELRRRWEEEAAVVKRLARQGLPDGHPALVAAQGARDAAEAAWRSAKQPAPIATRLRWAQEKLTRALELEETTKAAIAKAEEEHRRLMAQLHERRDVDAERVRKRRKGVEDLQAEIGGGAPATKVRDGNADAVLHACGSLCNSIGPELVALVERLQGGSEEWQAANKVLATLAASQRRMEEAAGIHDDRPQAYDIGDEDDDPEAMSETSQWSESHELREEGGASCADAGGGMGSDLADQAGDVEGADAARGVAAWHRWRDDQWQSPHWQADRFGRWHRASWADQWEAEQGHGVGWGMGRQAGAATAAAAAATTQGARRGGGAHDAETGEPSAKHRRQQPSDHSMGDGATAAPATGEGTAAASAAHGSVGAAAFARRVAEVVDRAINMGVQPITETGEELLTLSPELLSKWVSVHLDSTTGS